MTAPSLRESTFKENFNLSFPYFPPFFYCLEKWRVENFNGFHMDLGFKESALLKPGKDVFLLLVASKMNPQIETRSPITRNECFFPFRKFLDAHVRTRLTKEDTVRFFQPLFGILSNLAKTDRSACWGPFLSLDFELSRKAVRNTEAGTLGQLVCSFSWSVFLINLSTVLAPSAFCRIDENILPACCMRIKEHFLIFLSNFNHWRKTVYSWKNISSCISSLYSIIVTSSSLELSSSDIAAS